ncbi:MAG: ABC transporter permease [Gemmatimonadaceae bacterium]|nr:ABC transporter permease [Gemmatimonadaceae bacterium]
MRWREVYRFEVMYQLRRVWPWFVAAVLLLMSALITLDGMLQEALFENFYINSPYAVATSTVVGLLVWLLLSPGIAGDAAARDVATGLYPLLYTSPISRLEYLSGRFLAALTVNLLLLWTLPLGAIAAVYAPSSWTSIPAESMGPFRPLAYLTAYLYVGLPTVLAGTVLQFTLAMRSGRPMSAFLGSVALFFTSHGIGLFLLFQGRQDLASLIDPIGVHFILSDLSHLWTTTQKNVQLLELRGMVLVNRLLWLGLSIATWVWLTWQFRFAHRAEGAASRSSFVSRIRRAIGSRQSRALTRDAAPSSRVAATALAAPRAKGWALHRHQVWAIALESFRVIASSWAGRAMLIGLPLLMTVVIADQMTVNGVPMIPRTAMVLREITGPLASEMSRWVIIPLLIAYFAGELVWRERDAGLGDITDAMPGSEWARLLGKTLGLALILLVFVLLLMLSGMIAQLFSGFTDFEPWLYLRVMVGLQLTQYLLFVPLALAVHVATNHRYVGLVLAVLVYVMMALAPMFGIEHSMLSYGGGPNWSYTAMRGFGWSVAPWLWFTLYWASWALLLCILTRLLWVRGRDHRWPERYRAARGRFTAPTGALAAVAVLLVAGTGSWVFYNTNILNHYATKDEAASRRAEYERRYAYVARVPQPVVVSTTATVEFMPDVRTVAIQGALQLVNNTSASIDTVHVAAPVDATADSMRIVSLGSEAGRLVRSDTALHHYVFALATPMQPGDSLTLRFAVHQASRGFAEQGVSEEVARNGSQISSTLLPSIGYQSSRELFTAAERSRHGLTARPIVPRLDDTAAYPVRTPGVRYDLTIGTPGTQTGVAPGLLQQQWMRDGRSYSRYATSAPIGESFAILSAHYAQKIVQWRHVTIRVFYHPAHGALIPRMVESITASLALYSERYGPYPFTHLTAAEHPGNGSGMHADASILTFSEGFAQWNPEPGGLDMPFAIVAHEMGHQWNIPYASVEGAPVMSESVAWYLAWQVVEHVKGEHGLRQLHNFMHQPSPYPPIRRGEPLLRGLDPYMAYRKGPFALQAIHTAIGREAMDSVFRRLLATHRQSSAPLATTRDLYRELRAASPDSVHPLLHDLFEVNTYWQMTAQRAEVTPNADGTWQVAFEVRAQKMVYDSVGGETTVPFTDLVDIALYAEPDSVQKPRDRLSNVVYKARHRLVNGSQTITLNVPRKPVLAGIDPLHVLDWQELDGDNNFARVEPAPQGGSGTNSSRKR